MSTDDRARWEERHRHASALSPREGVLALPAPSLPGALALDLACGQGRHAIALVRLGYRVVAFDVARAALRHVVAARDGIAADRLLAVQGDVDGWPFAPAAFDLIVQVDFLDRSLFPRLRDSLRRDGHLYIDTYLLQQQRNAEGPSRPEFLLRCGELPVAFGDFEMLRYQERIGTTARATFLGRKPG